MFRTLDGGESWVRVLFVSDHTGAVDLVMDPSNPQILYASAWQAVSGEPVEAGEESGIFRSTDGGDSWEKLRNGLPDGPSGSDRTGRGAQRPDRVYAFVDNWGPSPVEDRAIVGGEVYRSDDRGESWRKVNEDDLYPVFGVYGWKFTDIRVSPRDPDDLFILGNRAFHSTDGGRTFRGIGEKIIRMHDTRGVIMHLDHHEIWIDPLNPDRVLLGNDGGLFQSWDRGESWLHINNIPAAEFYSISLDMSDPYRIFGGTQDNAALYGPSHLSVEDAIWDPWENVYLDQWTGGDSFDTYLDPTDSSFVYYEHQHGAMRRMDITQDSVLTGAAESIRPRIRSGEGGGGGAGAEWEEWRSGWYTPFIISHHDPFTLYVGGNRLLKSTNRGEDWVPISPDLSDPAGGPRAPVPFGTITMIAESELQAGTHLRGHRGWLGVAYAGRGRELGEGERGAPREMGEPGRGVQACPGEGLPFPDRVQGGRFRHLPLPVRRFRGELGLHRRESPGGVRERDPGGPGVCRMSSMSGRIWGCTCPGTGEGVGTPSPPTCPPPRSTIWMSIPGMVSWSSARTVEAHSCWTWTPVREFRLAERGRQGNE